MKKESIFLASAEIAKRINMEQSRYRTPDGKYILSEHDIRMLRFKMTPEEYIKGIDAKIITEKEADALIAKSTLGNNNNKEE